MDESVLPAGRRTRRSSTGQARGLVHDDIPADLLADQLGATGDGWMLMFPFESEQFTRVDSLGESVLTLISPRGHARCAPAAG